MQHGFVILFMNRRTIEVISVGFAVLAAGINIYFRFIRDWAMGFGPMIVVGLGTPVVFGLIGVLLGDRSEERRLILITLNLIAIGIGIAVGYVI